MRVPSYASDPGLESYLLEPNAPLWKQAVAFVSGFCIQFNVLVGGGGEGAAAVGGFGFRLIDFMSATAVALLAAYALAPRRILPLAVFGLLVATLFLLPIASSDPRTSTLAVHYVLYGFAALCVVLILSEGRTLEQFCWGLTIGLLATVPIFVLQDLGYTSTLIGTGLIPGYYYTVLEATGGTPRYAGLWGHPNEAGHISALAAAAGAYLTFAHRRFLALGVVALSLVTVFYYTQTRGGLLAGGAVLALPLLFPRGRRFGILRLVFLGGMVVAGVALMSQVGFIASRFEEDPATAGNLAERLDSTLFGLGLVLTNPLGLPADEFASLMRTGTGGVATPHNGFIFFAGIFGLLPAAVMGLAFIVNFRIREDEDVFFAYLSLQVALSCMFEQVPGSYSYAFVLCMILARAFLKTRIGTQLRDRPYAFAQSQSISTSHMPARGVLMSPHQDRDHPP